MSRPLAIVCMWCSFLSGLPAHAEAAETAPLDVPDAPAPEAPPAPWDGAETIHAHHFNTLPVGGWPAGWRFWPVQWNEGESPGTFLTIQETKGGDRVLRAYRPRDGVSFWLPFGRKLVGGRLRVQFDQFIRRGGDREGTIGCQVMDMDERVDFGWRRQRDIGPNFVVRGSKTKMVSYDNRNKPTVLGEVEPNRWQRVALVADLDGNRFDLYLDGERAAESVPFRDARWFAGADRLTIGARDVLLDNVSVLYLPGKGGGRGTQERQMVPPPSIPARRLDSAPALDGQLDDPVWQQAFHTDRFFMLTGEPSDEPQTEVWIGYHGDSLYVATRVRPRDMNRFHAIRTRPEATAVWDHMEVFVDPSLTRQSGKYLHFGFDAAGNRSQEQGFGGHWDSDWQVATHRAADHWTAEMKVDFATLAGACPPGDSRGAGHFVWGINVCRGRSVGSEHAAISPTYGNFHTPERFARLTGLTRAITLPMRCDLIVPDPLIAGRSGIEVKISGGRRLAGRDFELLVKGEGPEDARPHHAIVFRRLDARRHQTFTPRLPVSTPGAYYFQALVRAAGPDQAAGPPLAYSQQVFTHVVAPGTIEARTDRNYYTHEAIARVRGRLWDDAMPANGVVRLQVRGGEPAELLLDLRRPVAGSPFVVDLPLRDLPFGQLQLELTLLGPEEVELGRATVPLARHKPRHNEVKIRWDNFLLVDDEPFFPIYLLGDNDLVLRSHELGCNIAFAPWPEYLTPENLKMARHLQLRFIGKPAHHHRPNFEASARIMVNRFRDDPAILGWFLEDEIHAATVHEAPNSKLVKLAETIRRHDPYHPTYLNLMVRWTDNVVYGRVADAVSTDPYASYFHYNPAFVAQATRQLIKATRGRRPVWQMLQIFHYPVTRTHPNPVEFRHSAYSAVVHGATGIGLWRSDHHAGFANEDIRGLLADKPLWHEVKRVLRALRRLSPVITSDEPVDAPATCDNEHIAVMNKRRGGRLYVWLLNMREAPETAVVRVPAAEGRLINEIRPRASWPVSEGRCEMRLETLQPMVLRLDEK